MKRWKHDELLNDLAEHLARPERMLWRDLQLGPSGSPRPDVFTLRKSYKKPDPRAYEIKVSVSDFRADVTSGKWQSYLRAASGVTFCVPKGLITKADLPPSTGLMVRSEDGWRTVKAPTLAAPNLDQDLLLKLLIDGVNRIADDQRAHEFNVYRASRELRDQLGEDVASVVSDLQAAKDDLQRLKERAKKTRQKQAQAQEKQMAREREFAREAVARQREKLCEILGVDPKASDLALNERIRALEHMRSESELVGTASNIVRQLERSISSSRAQLDALGLGDLVEDVPRRRGLARS